MKKILLLASAFFYFTNIIIAQAGHLDPSFGTNGFVTTEIGENYSYSAYGKTVLTQADGSSYLLLQANRQALITKRHSNGSTDLSYGNNGFSAIVRMAYTSAAVLQPDGKILLGGSNEEFYDYSSVLARLNTDGSLDSSFSNDGVVNGFSSSIYSDKINVYYNKPGQYLVFPVPAKRNETIEIFTPLPQEETLTLFDAAGRTVLKKQIQSVHEYISTTPLSPGIYIYRIIKNGASVSAGKIVVL